MGQENWEVDKILVMENIPAYMQGDQSDSTGTFSNTNLFLLAIRV